MAEKVKTVIRCYFLLPDFKSHGHPTRVGLTCCKKYQKRLVWNYYFGSKVVVHEYSIVSQKHLKCFPNHNEYSEALIGPNIDSEVD